MISWILPNPDYFLESVIKKYESKLALRLKENVVISETIMKNGAASSVEIIDYN